MARFIKDRSKSQGQAPGSLIFIGQQKMDQPIITVIDYNQDELFECELDTFEATLPYFSNNNVSWINIYGLHDVELIKKIGDQLQLHPLLLEDLLNTDQRPKYDDEEHYDAFILKMLRYDDETSSILSEQISLVLGENFLLTIQEKRGDVFQPVRERIRNQKGRVRKKGSDYLAYVLMDAIIDNYLQTIEKIGNKIEAMEEVIFTSVGNDIAQKLYSYKNELSFIRKSVRPVKDLISHVSKSEYTFFKEDTQSFLRDLNDLITQTNDAVELYNTLLTDQLGLYNSNVGNRMNEVMKVLTLFASFFIPLTFIAGVYGMNFQYIPELSFKYSYLVFWVFVLIVSIVFIWYYKRKKWL